MQREPYSARAATRPTLDRPQREALREEMRRLTEVAGELVGYEIERADRDRCRQALEQLRECFDLLDAIGWTEHPDAPELQPIHVDRRARVWAGRQAQALYAAFSEFVPQDADLDAYRALCAIGNV